MKVTHVKAYYDKMEKNVIYLTAKKIEYVLL